MLLTPPSEILNRKLRFHPIRIITYLIILGISSAFFTLDVSYFVTTAGTVYNQFKFPQIFHANTILILASSYTVLQMKNAKLRDDFVAYKNALLVTSLLGIAFTGFQLLGWKELRANGIHFTNNISGTYLYLISGLHILHLLVGIGLLLWFLAKALLIEKDAYQTLLFDTDPIEKLKVEMLATYWHFVDIVWIFLYLTFLLTMNFVPDNWRGILNPF